jgi:hypothetical protein
MYLRPFQQYSISLGEKRDGEEKNKSSVNNWQSLSSKVI